MRRIAASSDDTRLSLMIIIINYSVSKPTADTDSTLNVGRNRNGILYRRSQHAQRRQKQKDGTYRRSGVEFRVGCAARLCWQSEHRPKISKVCELILKPWERAIWRIHSISGGSISMVLPQPLQIK